MMHIGELADKAGMSLRTLRHYDEVGLLTASGRTEGGFRLYTQEDYDRLIVIRRMKPLGFTLEEMAELLAVVDGIAAAETAAEQARLKAELSKFIDDALERRERLRTHVTWADEFIELLQARAS
jgi:DNA-binding transcriptional MerR regulator